MRNKNQEDSHKKLINNELKISYNSTSTVPQVFNLSNHSYFILDQAQDVSDYLLEINAFLRIQTDHQLLPTGKLLSLKNDTYHFSPPKKINKIILIVLACILMILIFSV